ncbi:hypothetical protein JOL62DRAFT_572035 [Phyllosticta paracitricarpa]|uniref:UBA domain-containing protein n=1 Tax=Phyllosticta paracitricarpa TaxID=2016321 RepID=A0ABR1N9K3_9PEZI
MYPVTEQTVAQIAPWPEPPPCLHNSPSRTQSVTKPPSSTSSWILGTGMRRRPESVFSRRGAATPVEEVAPDCTRCVPSEAPRKSSKRKPGRRRFSMEDKSGTILHAVPRAIVEDLSPRAMTAAFINRCIATPSCHSRSNSEGSSMDLPELRSEIYSISEETTALGDGNEKRSSIPIVQRPEDAFIAELDSRPLSAHDSRAGDMDSEIRSGRPSIQVVIPEQQRFPHFHLPNPSMSLAPTSNPAPPSAPQPSIAGDLISSRPVSPQVAARHPNVHTSMVSSLSAQSLLMKASTEAHPGQPWDPAGLTTLHQFSSSASSASNGSARDRDELSSNYSNSSRTSVTSVDDNGEPALRPKSQLYADGRTASQAFSVGSPIAAGVFDENTPVVVEQEGSTLLRSANSRAAARQEQARIPMAHPGQPFIPPSAKKTHEGAARRLMRKASAKQKSIVPVTRQTLGVEAGPSRMGPRTKPRSSPTLSEAETALEEHLCCLSPTSIDGGDREKPAFRESQLPPPPRKSSKRRLAPMLGSARTGTQSAPQVSDHAFHGVCRVPSFRLPPLVISKNRPVCRQFSPAVSKTNIRKYQNGPASNGQPSAVPRDIRPDAAEAVLCGILGSCHSLDDLFSLASVNRGFHYVFKRHELEIMQEVLRNESPPAWEFRQVAPPHPFELGTPESSLLGSEYTPASFYRKHKHDKIVISALKSLVLTRCQSFLRPETVMALAIDSNNRAQRMDDAFWRIWTFCKLFGCGKNREYDIVAQIDWLRGGPAAHQTDARATVYSGNSIDLSSVLANASDHFAKGNPGGLSAEELYDMTEIWTCLGVLLSGLEGRTAQAREYGVFELTDIRGGDIDGEERMLDEWIYYLLTLGPDVVLYLASPSNNPDPDAFQIAKEKGWIQWTPPFHDSSRCTFLKEAVSRVYEEKVAAMAAAHPRHNLEVRRNMRERIAQHKAEIHMRKRSGHCPLVRMSMERPISDWEGVFRSLGEPQRTASLCSGRSAARHAPLPPMPELPAMGENEIRATLHTRSISAPQPQSQTTSGMSAYKASPAARHTARSSIGGPLSSSVSTFSPEQSRSTLNTVHPLANHSNTSLATVSSVSTPGSFMSAPTLLTEPPSGMSTLAGNRQSPSFQHPKQFDFAPPNATNKVPSDPAHNTSEKAIFRLVEMGFTAEQAKYALMKTDLGDGLRLDRAVELLLRSG